MYMLVSSTNICLIICRDRRYYSHVILRIYHVSTYVRGIWQAMMTITRFHIQACPVVIAAPLPKKWKLKIKSLIHICMHTCKQWIIKVLGTIITYYAGTSRTATAATASKALLTHISIQLSIHRASLLSNFPSTLYSLRYIPPLDLLYSSTLFNLLYSVYSTLFIQSTLSIYSTLLYSIDSSLFYYSYHYYSTDSTPHIYIPGRVPFCCAILPPTSLWFIYWIHLIHLLISFYTHLL